MAKFRWSEVTTQTLLKALQEEALQGKKAENGFKKEAWTAVRSALKEEDKVDLEVIQLKSKWANVC